MEQDIFSVTERALPQRESRHDRRLARFPAVHVEEHGQRATLAMPVPPTAPAATPRRSVPLSQVSFDVSDLFCSFLAGPTQTGIQRIQQELCLELLGAEHGSEAELVVYDLLARSWRIVPNEWFISLLHAARNVGPLHRAWGKSYRKFAGALTTFPVKKFVPDEWLATLGGASSLPGYFSQIQQLRRNGVRVAAFLHDCLPVRHPAYFEQIRTTQHTHWLTQIREFAHLIVCNSEATRNDYLSMVQPLAHQSVRVCRLDGTRGNVPFPNDVEQAVSELLSGLGVPEQEFVLCAGTVEPRKNHALLVNVWDRLKRTHPEDCPKLLCVGPLGWKSEAVIAQAKALGLLDYKIHFLSGLPDEVLQALYKKCRFSIYISCYEGWGRPINESLAAGKVCIAGSSSSVPEAGAGYAIYVDERSEESVHQAVARLIENPITLSEANQRVAEGYKPRRWAEVLSEFLEVLGDPESNALPLLEMNVLYQFGWTQSDKKGDVAKSAEAMCLGDCWYDPEAWGSWTNKEAAEIGFRLSVKHQRPAIFLGLNSSPGGGSVTIHVNGRLAVTLDRFIGKKIVRVPLGEIATERDATGQFIPVKLRIVSSSIQNMGDIADSGDERILGVGYLFLIAFDRTSVFERLEFMEKVITSEI